MNGTQQLILAAALCAQLAACSGDEAAPRGEEESATPAEEIDWSAVDEAMGRSGALQDGGVYRYGMPRSDLAVTSQGVQIQPAFALGSWVAFKQSGPNEVVAMGDLVLTQSELNPVVARLQEGGVGQTAVHQHLPEHSPRVWWTHIHAHGDPVAIARAIRAGLELSATPPASPGGGDPPAIALDTAEISRIFGRSGRNNGGIYNVSVPRNETIRSMGIDVPPSMGLSTVLNFQPTGGNRAAINGDFVMTAGEVDAVIAALRENGIEVVSLHNHLTDEEPRLLFMHFWGHDDAAQLARGLRAALDRTNSERPGR